MKEVKKTFSPTLPSERMVSLDVLKGFALLGILFANIQVNAMIKITESNPTAFGDLIGINYVVAMLTNIIIYRKFYILFSLLFGAGIVALQLAYSNWWLNRFRFGPVEWLNSIGYKLGTHLWGEVWVGYDSKGGSGYGRIRFKKN